MPIGHIYKYEVAQVLCEYAHESDKVGERRSSLDYAFLHKRHFSNLFVP